MKKINWFLGALLTIVGLLILIFPAACVKTVAVLLGLGSIAYGIFCLIDSKNETIDDDLFKKVVFIKAIASIILGILTVILPLAIASTAWKIMVYIFAIYLIVAACFGFYSVSKFKDVIEDGKKKRLENFSLLIAGVLLMLISPQKLGIFIIRCIGFVALVIGLVLLIIVVISYINNRKNEIVVEAEVKDDTTENNE